MTKSTTKVGKVARSATRKPAQSYARAVFAPNVIGQRRLTPSQRRAMVRAMLKTA